MDSSTRLNKSGEHGTTAVSDTVATTSFIAVLVVSVVTVVVVLGSGCFSSLMRIKLGGVVGVVGSDGAPELRLKFEADELNEEDLYCELVGVDACDDDPVVVAITMMPEAVDEVDKRLLSLLLARDKLVSVSWRVLQVSLW